MKDQPVLVLRAAVPMQGATRITPAKRGLEVSLPASAAPPSCTVARTGAPTATKGFPELPGGGAAPDAVAAFLSSEPGAVAWQKFLADSVADTPVVSARSDFAADSVRPAKDIMTSYSLSKTFDGQPCGYSMSKAVDGQPCGYSMSKAVGGLPCGESYSLSNAVTSQRSGASHQPSSPSTRRLASSNFSGLGMHSNCPGAPAAAGASSASAFSPKQPDGRLSAVGGCPDVVAHWGTVGHAGAFSSSSTAALSGTRSGFGP